MRKSKAPAYYTARVRKQIAGNRRAWGERYRQIKKEYCRRWDPRAFSDYAYYFKPFFPEGLFNAIKQMKKHRPLRILDDGAGDGLALATLKWELLGAGIKSETTALTLKNPPKGLLDRKKNGLIDNIVEAHAEFFVPKKSFDVIFSVFGSTSYTLPSARKDHFLKLANSLAKGGIMLVIFQIDVRETELFHYNFGRRIADFSELPDEKKQELNAFTKSRLAAIQKALEKRNFEVKMIYQGHRGTGSSLLYVKRK